MSTLLPVTSITKSHSERIATSLPMSAVKEAKEISLPFIPAFSPQEKLLKNLYLWGITNEWGDPMPEYADIPLPKISSKEVHAWLDAPYTIVGRENMFVIQTTLRKYVTGLRMVLAQHPSLACTNLEISGEVMVNCLSWNQFEQVFHTILERYNQKTDKPLKYHEMFPLELLESLKQELMDSEGRGTFHYCMDKATPQDRSLLRAITLQYTTSLGNVPLHIVDEFAMQEAFRMIGFTEDETRIDLSFDINNPRHYAVRHENVSLPCLDCLENAQLNKEFTLEGKNGKGLNFFLDRLTKALDVDEPEKVQGGGISLLAYLYQGFQVYRYPLDSVIFGTELRQNKGLPPFHILKALWENSLQTLPQNDPWDYLLSAFIICQSVQPVTPSTILGAFLDLVLMDCLTRVVNEPTSPGLKLFQTAAKLLTRRSITFERFQALLLIGGLASIIKPSTHSATMIQFGLTRFRGSPALSTTIIGQKKYTFLVPIDLPKAFTELGKLKNLEGDNLSLFQTLCESFFHIPFETGYLESRLSLPYQNVSWNIPAIKDQCIELMNHSIKDLQEIAYSLYLSLGFIEEQLTDKKRFLNATLKMLTECQKPQLLKDWIQGLENLLLKHHLTPLPQTLKQPGLSLQEFYTCWSRFLISNHDEEIQSLVLGIWDKLDHEVQVTLAQEIPAWVRNFPSLANSLWNKVCKLDEPSTEAFFFLLMETESEQRQFKSLFDLEVQMRAQELGVGGDPLLYILNLLSRVSEERYVFPLSQMIGENIRNSSPTTRKVLLTKGSEELIRKELWDEAARWILATDSADAPQDNVSKIIKMLLTTLSSQRIDYILELDCKYSSLTILEWRQLYEPVLASKNKQHKERMWFIFKRQVTTDTWKSLAIEEKQKLWAVALSMLHESESTAENDILTFKEHLQNDFVKAKSPVLLTEARLKLLQIALKLKHDSQKVHQLRDLFKSISERLLTTAEIIDYVTILSEDSDPKIILETLQLLQTRLFSSDKKVEESYLPTVKKVFDNTINHKQDDEICKVLVNIINNILKVDQFQVIKMSVKALSPHENSKVVVALYSLCSKRYFSLLQKGDVAELPIDTDTTITIVQKAIFILDWKGLMQSIKDILGLSINKVASIISLPQLNALTMAATSRILFYHQENNTSEHCYKALDFLTENWEFISKLPEGENLQIGALILLAHSIGTYGSREHFEKYCLNILMRYIQVRPKEFKGDAEKDKFAVAPISNGVYQTHIASLNKREKSNHISHSFIIIPEKDRLATALAVPPGEVRMVETISRFILALKQVNYAHIKYKAYAADFILYNLQYHIQFYPSLGETTILNLKNFVHFITPNEMDFFPFHSDKAIETIKLADRFDLFNDNRESTIGSFYTYLQKDSEAVNNILNPPQGDELTSRTILRKLKGEITLLSLQEIIESVNQWQQRVTGKHYDQRRYCLYQIFCALKKIIQLDTAQKKTIYDKLISVVIPTTRIFDQANIDPDDFDTRRTCKECLILLFELTFSPVWNPTVGEKVEWLNNTASVMSNMFKRGFFTRDNETYFDLLKLLTGYVLKVIKGKPKGSEELVTVFTNLCLIQVPKGNSVLVRVQLSLIEGWLRLLTVTNVELAKLAQMVLSANKF